MKKGIFNLFLATSIAFGTVACKNENSNRVDANEAEEASTATTEAQDFRVDSSSSEMEWRGTKPTGEHRGTIDIQSGMISATEDGRLQSGQVVIDMNSIEVTDEGMSEEDKESLENHLKGTVEGKETDFFNVRKYPTATFEVTGTTEREGQTYLQGNLTLKETTKNIEIPVTTRVENDQLIMESDRFVIDRTDWGVNYGSRSVFDNLGDNFISDEMELKISVRANRA